MPPRNDLSDMTYDFVSLVDFPANRPAQVVLAKRDVSKGRVQSDDLDENAEDVEDDNDRRGVRKDAPADARPNRRSTNPETTDDEGGVGEPDGPKSKQPTATGANPGGAAKRDLSLTKGGHLSRSNLDLGEEEEDQDIEGYSDDEDRSPNESGRLRGASRTAKGAQPPMSKCHDGLSSDEHQKVHPSFFKRDDDLPEVITKADLDRIMKGYEARVEKAEARAAAAEELAKAEADKIARREAVEKTDSWVHIPQLTSSDFSDHWLAISKHLPDAAEVLEKIFDATEAALAQGNSLYRSAGRSNSGTSAAVAKGGDPMAPITAAAAQIRKSSPELTLQQAIVKVMQSQPDLAESYRQSMGFIPEGGYQPS